MSTNDSAADLTEFHKGQDFASARIRDAAAGHRGTSDERIMNTCELLISLADEGMNAAVRAEPMDMAAMDRWAGVDDRARQEVASLSRVEGQR